MKRRIDHYASFKDPAAKVFSFEDEEDYIYRSLSPGYLIHYRHFNSSGLADELMKKKLLIPFEENGSEEGSVLLKAKKIPFVTYPNEWTFSQWKDAALLTLKIQHLALKFGMILKDATPFNIVFDGYRPFFIDISSFEIFTEGEPWKGFRQFSENFYLPILLVLYFDSIGNNIYAANPDGIPLKKGLSLLPAKAFFNFNTLLFLTMPARIRDQSKSRDLMKVSTSFTVKRTMQFAEQLFNNISKLVQPKLQTKWNDYYDKNIEPVYLQEKEKIVKDWLGKGFKDKTLIDFGCNTGHFSKLLSSDVKKIIAFDEDMRSTDALYKECKAKKIENIFCFTASLAQPTPATGWNNSERESLKDRLHGDTGLALALIHHLAITSYINFEMMAAFFAETCNELLIEFVPKEDPKVQLLLKDREDIFAWYDESHFIGAFKERFNLEKEHRFSNNRILLHFILKR